MPSLEIFPAPLPPRPWWVRAFLDNSLGAAFASALLTALLGTGLVWLGTGVWTHYGWALFFGVPTFCGYLSTTLYSHAGRRFTHACIGVMTLSLALLGVMILCFALEGLLCLIMAFPIAWLMGLLGALLAQATGDFRRRRRARADALTLALLPLLVLLLYGEARLPLAPPVRVVTTTQDIAADPATVWRFVPACPPLPPPVEKVFQFGIAFPEGTRMHGAGLGAERACLLSTGVMRERVTVWEPARCLRFTVLSTPCAMHELSFYRDLQPPHLHDFCVMREGEIQLLPLPGGGTRLVGTSRYEQRLWPAAYWMLWSDYVVHSVHHRVFSHLQQLAEHEAAAAKLAANPPR